MPYYKELNILFIHIPKTGGTSFEDYLKKKYNETLFSINGKPSINNITLQHQLLRDIFKYKKLLKIKFDKKLKIITFVRNPYDRIISDLFYFNLIDKNEKPKDVYNIIKNYLKKEREYYDNHYIPQYLFISDKNGNIYKNIHICRTETLTKNLHNLGFTDYKGKKYSNTYYKYLNKDSIELINKIYKKDFELFNYDKIKTTYLIKENMYYLN